MGNDDGTAERGLAEGDSEDGGGNGCGARRDSGDGKSWEGDEKYQEERRGEKKARKADTNICLGGYAIRNHRSR